MDKRDGLLALFGAVFESVGWGIGMLSDLPAWISWTIIITGAVALIYIGVRIIKYKPAYQTWHELKAIGDSRILLLDRLLHSIEDITNYYKSLFDVSVNANVEYIRKQRKTHIVSAFKELGRYVFDNPHYRRLREQMPKELQAEYDSAVNNIEDKRLAKLLRKFWRCERQSTSVLIFWETMRALGENIPLRNKRIYTNEDIAKQEYQDCLKLLQQRINELKGGIPYEL